MKQARIHLYATQTELLQSGNIEKKKKAKKSIKNPNSFRIHPFQQEAIKTIFFKTKVIRLNCANFQQTPP